MASGRRHWQARLRALSTQTTLGRSDRRQLRKLLGRLWSLEWRSLGNVRGGIRQDALNDEIVRRSREVGHVARRLAEQAREPA